jgi:two-component system cell cycle sensor histidine kinase/response regulator CckA
MELSAAGVKPSRVARLRQRPAAGLAAWVGAYLVAALYVDALHATVGSSVWYAPLAIGIGLLLRHGLRWWPLILAMEAGLAWVHPGDGLGAGQPGIASAIASTAEAFVGAWLASRLRLDRGFADDALGIVALAVVTAAIGATTGAALILLAPAAADAADYWVTSWIGDVAAITTVLPVVLLILRPEVEARHASARRGWQVELVLLLGAAVAVVALATVVSIVDPVHGGGFRFLWVVPVLWASIRFDRWATAVVVALIATVSCAALLPLAEQLDLVDLVGIQLTLIASSMIGFVVAATLAARRRAIDDLEVALRALDASELRYETLFAGSPLIQFLVEPSTAALVDANEAAAAFYGWPVKELRTMNVGDLSTAAPSVILGVMGESATRDIHVLSEHRLADGELRQVEVLTGPVVLGGRVLVHSVIRDVTAEAAARTEMARLAAVVGSSAEGIVTTDLDGRITGWNPAAELLYGYPRADVQGRDIDAVLGPTGASREELARTVRDGRSIRYGEVVRRTAGGDPVPVDLTISPIIQDGTVVGMSRISHDLRHVLEAQERLERSEALLADAAEIGGMGSWEVDWVSGIATWSGELYRLTGLDPAATVVATTLVDLAHPDDRDRLAAAMGEEQAPATPIAFRLIGPDRRERSMVTTWRHVAATGGSAGRDVGVVRDVTEERILEAQLRQAQRMESIGLLAGGVAHDFNNLLTAIAGFTDLARTAAEEGVSPDADLLQVKAAVDRARSLTSQLLTFGRRAIIRPQPVDLAAAARDLVPMLQRLLGERITVVPELGEGAVAIIDPGQLDQVLINLAVNARDAMPGGGRLRVAAGRVGTPQDEGDAAMAWVEVEDDGDGMEPDILEQIFLPFFTTKVRGQGTGLGLSTAQGIVAMAGGRIVVSSQPGAGTVFRIELPLTGLAPVGEPAGDRSEPRTGEGLILFVEDEELVRRVGERVLSRAGFRVASAANVADAIAVAERERPDILVTDIVLPGTGDGITLAETLRRRWPDLPVLIMTGYTERTPPEWAALLTKPYEVDQLIATVHRLLDEARTAPAP